MAEPRLIKRYSNRKLYDTQRSRYITLEQIAEMIRASEDVKIIDNNSKEDLTSATLAQIIFEEEKNKRSLLPLSALRNMIQTGGDSIQEFASQAGARVRSVFRREDEGEVEAPPAGPSPEGEPLGPGHLIREFLERSHETFDEWQKRVDERVNKVVETLAPWVVLEKELSELRERLSDMEKRLHED